MVHARHVFRLLRHSRCKGFNNNHSSLLVGFHYVNFRKFHGSSILSSIFSLKNQEQQEHVDTEVPDFGTLLESWYFDVQQYGRLKVKSPMDIHIQPIDPQKYPEMNKVFINILHVGKEKLRISEMQKLMKQYVVNLDVEEFNAGIVMMIDHKVNRQLETLCHIQIPLQYGELGCF